MCFVNSGCQFFSLTSGKNKLLESSSCFTDWSPSSISLRHSKVFTSGTSRGLANASYISFNAWQLKRGFKFIEPAPNRHFSIIGKVWGRGNLFEMIFWCNLSNYTEDGKKNGLKIGFSKSSALRCLAPAGATPSPRPRHSDTRPPPLLSSSPLYLFALPLISTMLFLSGFYSSRTAA